MFKFWEGVSPSTKVHPKDAAVFEENEEHNLELECLPNPYYGPLRTAPIVLLYLNPGFSEKRFCRGRKRRTDANFIGVNDRVTNLCAAKSI